MKKNESEVQKEIVGVLNASGWVVRTFNSALKVRSGLVGWYDLVAIKHNCVLFIEVKAEGKRSAVRDSQKKLHSQVESHTGPNVQQIVADDVLQVLEVIHAGLSSMREEEGGKVLRFMRLLLHLRVWLRQAIVGGRREETQVRYNVVGG